MRSQLRHQRQQLTPMRPLQQQQQQQQQLAAHCQMSHHHLQRR
jgi:hypothetical protein